METGAAPEEDLRQGKRFALWVVLIVAALAGGSYAFVRSASLTERRALVRSTKFAFMLRAGTADVAESVDRRVYALNGKLGEGHGNERRREAKEAAERFMEACTACAAPEVCERDRLTILAGNGSEAYNPCD
jgi:hypothetical protein